MASAAATERDGGALGLLPGDDWIVRPCANRPESHMPVA